MKIKIEAVIEAMEYTKNFTGFAWWLDGPVDTVLNFGVKNGWLRRISTTQIEWTAKAVNECQK